MYNWCAHTQTHALTHIHSIYINIQSGPVIPAYKYMTASQSYMRQRVGESEGGGSDREKEGREKEMKEGRTGERGQ